MSIPDESRPSATDPETQYPTDFILTKSRRAARNRKIMWTLAVLAAAAAAVLLFTKLLG